MRQRAYVPQQSPENHAEKAGVTLPELGHEVARHG